MRMKALTLVLMTLLVVPNFFAKAIELLKNGLAQGNYSLRKFVDWMFFLAPLEDNGRFKSLLAEEERACQKSEAAVIK